MEYASLRGTMDGMDFTAITEIAEYFEREINYLVPPKTPFVGRAFNSTRAGIHADGMLKDEEIYNIFDTAKLFNRPARVAVDKTSGLAGIAFWINDYYKLPDDVKVDKADPLVLKMKELIDREYEEGRNSSFGDDELVNLIYIIDSKRIRTLAAYAMQ